MRTPRISHILLRHVTLVFMFFPFAVAAQGNENSNLWTCSMHPQIKLEEPGQCPICGMDLIPLKQEKDHRDMNSSAEENGRPSALTLSKTAEKLAELQVSEVMRTSVTKHVRLYGVIDFNETQLHHITAWVPGRIVRMFVDYTGITVRKGDHMVQLYSPELISAQEELIQARSAYEKIQQSGSTLLRKPTEQTWRAAREKLLLLGLTKGQVTAIQKRGEPQDNITIYAPAGGVVVERNATEGMYVERGTNIYSLADLNSLWVMLDAYQSDLPWIRYGQGVSFQTEALPGTIFNGKIAFISPVLDPTTRSSKVRVNVENDKGLLKPGMFVSAAVKTDILAQGKVMDTSLQGKYICPMHPNVIEESPGDCPICDMDLVESKELGYEPVEKDMTLPLVIPKTAPLITGERAVVYVKDPDQSRYYLREVTLGPKAGKHYIVNNGLREGEMVVTRGAFKIDADLQIQGKQSMMNRERATEQHDHHHHQH